MYRQSLAGLERVVPNDTRTAGRLNFPLRAFPVGTGRLLALLFGRAMIMTRRKIAWSSR